MEFIDRAQIDTYLSFPKLVDALDQAFAGNWVTPVRHHHDMEGEGVTNALLLMPSWTGPASRSYVGVKMVTVHPENGKVNLPSIHGVYYLAKGETGESLCLQDGTRLTVWRTAAASALASRYLSRPDSKVLTMLGSGALAPFMIKAHMSVRPIEEVRIWNRNLAGAEKLALTLRDEGLNVTAVTDLESAIRTSDIVSSATISTTPLILGDWVPPGTHVDTVGAYLPTMRETDDNLVRKATIVCDTFGGAFKEAGDLVLPIAAGVINSNQVVADLHDLTRKTHPGRTSDTEITYFKSVGTALEDLAAAVVVWETHSA